MGDIGFNFGEIRHRECHEISRHQQRRSKVIPIEMLHSLTVTKSNKKLGLLELEILYTWMTTF